MSQTPIYDQLAAHSKWTPDQLRPPLDMRGLIAESYTRAQTRRALRRKLLARRANERRNRARRTVRLP